MTQVRSNNKITAIIGAQQIKKGSTMLYDASEPMQSNWFVVDLETGSRGWFPGCIKLGQLAIGNTIKLYIRPDLESIILDDLSTVQEVKILDQINDWSFVEYEHTQGYIQTKFILKIIYK